MGPGGPAAILQSQGAGVKASLRIDELLDATDEFGRLRIASPHIRIELPDLQMDGTVSLEDIRDTVLHLVDQSPSFRIVSKLR